MRLLHSGLAAALVMSVLGCGAKTGLRLPDVGVQVDAVDVQDVFDVQDVGDVCMPPRFPLMRRTAELMFVIDRSNSMRLDLMGGDTHGDLELSRWAILRNALRAALPPFESTVAMGATVFPGVLPPNATTEDQCSAPSAIDLRPVRNNSQPIVQIFRTTQPGGGTPTFGALQVTANFLRANQTRGVAQYMVLATDGGPNCNTDLDFMTCACTSRDGNGMPNCSTSANIRWNCLDDQRTIAEITRIVGLGIPTFVIGIDDPTRPDLADVLNRMAVAGSRPNMRPGEERYYSVRRAEDLTSAFNTIQRTIAQCSFVTTNMPTGLGNIVLELNGRDIPRDTTRMDGWDWTDMTFGEITLFGTACDMVVNMPAAQVAARIPCDLR